MTYPNISKTFFWTVLCLLYVFPVLASGGHGEAPTWDAKFSFGIINFFLLVFGLVYILKKPMREFFSNRSLNIAKEIQSAQQLRDEAYRKYEEIEAKLKNADVEGKNLMAAIKNESESEKQSMIEQAQKIAQKIKEDAQSMAQQEFLRVKQELQSEVVDLAARLATKKIEKEISSEQQVSLGAEFVTHVKKGDVA